MKKIKALLGFNEDKKNNAYVWANILAFVLFWAVIGFIIFAMGSEGVGGLGTADFISLTLIGFLFLLLSLGNLFLLRENKKNNNKVE